MEACAACVESNVSRRATGPYRIGRRGYILALASWDAMRGFAIASMVLVNNPGDWAHLHAPLAHAKWNGWTFTDTFPFSSSSRARRWRCRCRPQRRRGGDARSSGRVRRASRRDHLRGGTRPQIHSSFDPMTVRIPGVCKRIALCALIAAPIVIGGLALGVSPPSSRCAPLSIHAPRARSWRASRCRRSPRAGPRVRPMGGTAPCSAPPLGCLEDREGSEGIVRSRCLRGEPALRVITGTRDVHRAAAV